MPPAVTDQLRHARKAWPGTLEDPCLLSGKAKENGKKAYRTSRLCTSSFFGFTIATVMAHRGNYSTMSLTNSSNVNP
jgi:hypothetical protein